MIQNISLFGVQSHFFCSLFIDPPQDFLEGALAFWPALPAPAHSDLLSFLFIFVVRALLCCKADSYAYEKLIRKCNKSVLFGFFQSYGYENGPDWYGQIRLSFS